MPDSDNILDVDFDAQMQGLFQQAERAIGQRTAVSAKAAVPPPLPQEATDSIVIDEMPGDPTASLAALPTGPGTANFDTAVRELESTARAVSECVGSLPKVVSDLKALLEMKNGVSHSMFSALHEELKGYKDGFLLQSVYRPIIRDLVSVYDDLTEIHRQINEAITNGAASAEESENAKKLLDRMRTMEMNIGHNVEFILEVLARLEVTRLPLGTGKLDKCRQRAVAVEPTANPEEDTLVVRVSKRGFLWHERVLRPEEVVVKRYNEAQNSAPAAQS